MIPFTKQKRFIIFIAAVTALMLLIAVFIPAAPQRDLDTKIAEAKAEFSKINQKYAPLTLFKLKRPEVILPPLLVLVREDLQEYDINEQKIRIALEKNPQRFVSEVPELKRKRFLLLLPSEAAKIGDRYERKKISDKEGCPAPERLKHIAKKLKEQFPIRVPNRLVIYNDESVNAFCLPNGTVYIHSGLLNAFPNDDQLAFVIAHEYAHYIAQHYNEQFTKTMFLLAGGFFVLQRSNKIENDGKTIRAILLRVGYLLSSKFLAQLPYSRKMEYEADTLAIRYVVRAGFNPQGSIDFFETQEKNNKNPFWTQWFSTHPADLARLKRLRQEIQKISSEKKENT